METISVIYVEPGRHAGTIEMNDELSAMQELEKKYTEKFKQPKRFFKTPTGYKAVKYDPAEPQVWSRD